MAESKKSEIKNYAFADGNLFARMTSKLRLLVWALTLQILPLHAQEEDHSNDDIKNPNTPITLTTNFHCINIYKFDPTLDPSQSPTKLCPSDSPFPSYNFDIWLSCGFPHDGPERTSPTQYLRATWLSHVTLSWQSDSAILDERYTVIQTSVLDMQPSRTRAGIHRGCNPRKDVELNPYWVDFEKSSGERDALTWGDGGLEYDKGIRNSVCGTDRGGKEGPFNTEGLTKGSKSTTTGGGVGGQNGLDHLNGLTTTPTSSSSLLLPVVESSFVGVDDGTSTSTTTPLLSSSPDDDTGKPIDTFFSTAPSSPSIALYNDVNNDNNNNNNNNNNNSNDQATTRSDPNLFIRRRMKKRPAAVT